MHFSSQNWLIAFNTRKAFETFTSGFLFFLSNRVNRNFSMAEKQECCCCSVGKCHGYKSKIVPDCTYCAKSVESSDDQNVLKAVLNKCEICGQNISPKEFGGVRRLRCPCHHVSGACGDGVFPSHSDDILGIIVSQSLMNFFLFVPLEFIFHFPLNSTRRMSQTMKTTMEKCHRGIPDIRGWTGVSDH